MRLRLLAVRESGDYVTETEEWLVDFSALIEAFTGGSWDPDSLGPGEIDEVEFSDSDLLVLVFAGVLVIGCHLLNDDDEDGMRAGGVVIHSGGCCGSGLRSFLDERKNFAGGSHCPFWEAFYENSSFFIVSDFEVLSFLSEKIWDDFIIDLEVAGSDHEGCLWEMG